jgi:hypothetical protein
MAFLGFVGTAANVGRKRVSEDRGKSAWRKGFERTVAKLVADAEIK